MKKIFLKILSVFSFMCMFMFNVNIIEGQDSNNNSVSDETIHVFYFSDDGYAMPTGVSITSLLSNSGDDKINVHIVSFEDNKMSDENINKISSLKRIKDFDLDFVYFDKSKLNEFNTEHWSKGIIIKLYAAELFPSLDRVIWLDGDTIILKSLKELYNRKDLENHYLAGVDVHDIYNKYYNRKCNYWITAGIGLYNLKEMRKDNIQEKLLASARQYSISHDWRKCCGGVEEFALTNGLPKDKVLVLPYEYSVMAYFHQKRMKNPINLDNCVMLHMTGPEKPWRKKDRKSINKNMLKIWDNYCDIYNKYSDNVKDKKNKKAA